MECVLARGELDLHTGESTQEATEVDTCSHIEWKQWLWLNVFLGWVK